jgi:D-alanine-D-alanine ligase
MNIAVVMGGVSTERNISLSGGMAVVNALREKGHNVVAVDPAYGSNYINPEEVEFDVSHQLTLEDIKDLDATKYLEMMSLDLWKDIDVAFIVLHGKYGEDGLIQSLFELKGIPHTGSNVKTCAVTMDKNFTKIILSSYGILTPKWIGLHREDLGNENLPAELRKEFGNKIVIKPNDQGSSIGITIVKNGNLDDIHSALEFAAKYSETIIVEEFIEGKEITCGLIDGQALPLIEIVPKDDFYNYSTKYKKGNSDYFCPAELTEDVTEFIKSTSEVCNRILGVEGFARIDYRLSEENEPYFLEINVIPGFTSTSLVPKAAKEIGIEFPELCETIVNLAVKKGGE